MSSGLLVKDHDYCALKLKVNCPKDNNERKMYLLFNMELDLQSCVEVDNISEMDAEILEVDGPFFGPEETISDSCSSESTSPIDELLSNLSSNSLCSIFNETNEGDDSGFEGTFDSNSTMSDDDRRNSINANSATNSSSENKRKFSHEYSMSSIENNDENTNQDDEICQNNPKRQCLDNSGDIIVGMSKNLQIVNCGEETKNAFSEKNREREHSYFKSCSLENVKLSIENELTECSNSDFNDLKFSEKMTEKRNDSIKLFSKLTNFRN